MAQVILKRSEVEQKAQEAGYDKSFIAFLGHHIFDIERLSEITVEHMKRILEATHNRPMSEYEYECGAEYHGIEVADFKNKLKLMKGFLTNVTKP